MSENVRLGRMSYLNVLPIYHPLEAGIIDPGPVEFVYGPPAVLNGMMAKGELDLSATSSVEYFRGRKNYALLDDLAIGSKGHVQSVLLLSKLPIAQLQGRPILVSAETHTSAALLRIYLEKRIGIEPLFDTGSITDRLAQGEEPEAFLAIGDEALRLRNLPSYPHRWDMGGVWQSWTGLPFIFGVWIASNESLQTKPEAMAKAHKALVDAKNWSAKNMDIICKVAREQGNLPVNLDLESYFEGLSYDLGDIERQGLEAFRRQLEESGR